MLNELYDKYLSLHGHYVEKYFASPTLSLIIHVRDSVSHFKAHTCVVSLLSGYPLCAHTQSFCQAYKEISILFSV
jgi:hypothetical protein